MKPVASEFEDDRIAIASSHIPKKHSARTSLTRLYSRCRGLFAGRGSGQSSIRLLLTTLEKIDTSLMNALDFTGTLEAVNGLA